LDTFSAHEQKHHPKLRKFTKFSQRDKNPMKNNQFIHKQGLKIGFWTIFINLSA